MTGFRTIASNNSKNVVLPHSFSGELIKNFGKIDRLVIEGEVFKYNSLNNKKTNNALQELGIVVDTIGSD